MALKTHDNFTPGSAVPDDYVPPDSIPIIGQGVTNQDYSDTTRLVVPAHELRHEVYGYTQAGTNDIDNLDTSFATGNLSNVVHMAWAPLNTTVNLAAPVNADGSILFVTSGVNCLGYLHVWRRK